MTQFTPILCCPVCRQALIVNGKTVQCNSRHCFDVSKDGYVNLLLSGKPGEDKGDNKEMARSRRDFLNKGFYQPLAQAIGECAEKYTREGDSVLDICCGEGYYTDYLTKRFFGSRAFYGFDISKNMVRLAGKRRCGADFFVANIANIPVQTASVKMAFHLFAPFHAAEFSRILSDEGVLVTAIPGRRHLFGLKQALYDTPYENDEKQPDAGSLVLCDTLRVRDEITLSSQEDINALFQMTPYYYHTPAGGMARLKMLNHMQTEIEFVLLVYRKG